MPTIAQLVAKNEARQATSVPEAVAKVPIFQVAPAPITFPGTPELPLRSTLPPNLFAADQVTAGSQPTRLAARTSVFLSPQAVSNDTTPTTLRNKKLLGPIIGNGSPLGRYNALKATIVPKTVAANTAATQTFTVAGVQAADKVLGFQWGTAQAVGVTVQAVRVTGPNKLAIDFYNPTGGSLTPTGGTLTLFLVQ
jgi:hypothetical protein